MSGLRSGVRVEVPSEITGTPSHFSQVVASQEDAFLNNRHINRNVTDRETSQLTPRTREANTGKKVTRYSTKAPRYPFTSKHLIFQPVWFPEQRSSVEGFVSFRAAALVNSRHGIAVVTLVFGHPGRVGARTFAPGLSGPRRGGMDRPDRCRAAELALRTSNRLHPLDHQFSKTLQ